MGKIGIIINCVLLLFRQILKTVQINILIEGDYAVIPRISVGIEPYVGWNIINYADDAALIASTLEYFQKLMDKLCKP